MTKVIQGNDRWGLPWRKGVKRLPGKTQIRLRISEVLPESFLFAQEEGPEKSL